MINKDLEQYFETADVNCSAQKLHDPRIGHILGKNVKDWKPPRAALIGYPSDEGIKRNGGRIGASFAPDLIRDALFRLTPDVRNAPAFCALVEESVDLGNLKLDENVEGDQKRLGEIVEHLLTNDIIPIILGGGHDLSFGHFTGYSLAQREVSILNFDSHPDVRELVNGKAHSGSPFFQALEHESKLCKKYSVFGLEPYAISESQLQFLEEHDCETYFQDELKISDIDSAYSRLESDCMVSFDIDVLSQGIAPGVSARVRGHMPLEHWNHAAFEAGKNSHVKSFDIVECNPKYDSDSATSRLAAQTIWHFLRGLALRQRH